MPAHEVATAILLIVVPIAFNVAFALAPWLGWPGVAIGVALLVGTLEFFGPNEPEGWRLAGTLVPIAYIAWSIWLIVLGIGLLLG